MTKDPVSEDIVLVPTFVKVFGDILADRWVSYDVTDPDSEDTVVSHIEPPTPSPEPKE